MRIVPVHRKDGSIDEVSVLDPYEMMEIIKGMEPSYEISSKGIGHEKTAYLTEFGTFDIESTTMPGKKSKRLVKHKDGSQTLETVWEREPWAFMYCWQFCLSGKVCFGRRWEEFFDLLEAMSTAWHLKDIKHIVIYVHNLGFELQYLYPFLFEKYGAENVKIFATKEHQPVYVQLPNGIEFRCSWKLTNMNLYMFTHTELGSPYEKAWGDLDYKKIRTVNTPLDDKEMEYCVLDVLALWHSLMAKMHADRDTLATIPITSTGYPRRDCRRACRAFPKYREKYFLKNLITEEIYELLEEIKRGGNTHADRFQAARILFDVDSYDYVSEYPGAMLLFDYPMEAFSRYGKPESLKEFEEVMNSGRAVIARITLVNPRVKKDVPVPYIPIDKLTARSGKLWGDNGRVLSIEGHCSITINEVDWQIIKKQYDRDGILCEGLWTARKTPLPEPIRQTIMKYFAQKCELKEAVKEAERQLKASPKSKGLIDLINDLEYKLGKVKNMLNGIFGMIYTDPVHMEILMDECGKWAEGMPEGKSVQDLLDKYNKSRNSFLCFTWGPWVTSYGRYMLDRLQECAFDKESGRHVCAYSDTDSAKSSIWDKEKLDALITEMQGLARERGAVYVSKSGREYLMGYPDYEGTYKRFITMGAKKYAYEDESGLLHVTVSGVSNTHAPGDELGAGARELMQHGGIEAFRLGFKFNEAGGQTVWYGHEPVHKIKVRGVIMTTASYAAVTDGEYTLGQTEEYKKLLGSL